MDEQRVQVAGVRVNKGKNGDNQHTSHQVLLVPVMGKGGRREGWAGNTKLTEPGLEATAGLLAVSSWLAW